MHLLTQSALLRALGWSLLNSLWQMAGLWLSYWLLLAVFRNASARSRHGLAFLLLGIGTAWSGVTFVSAYFFPGRPVHLSTGYPIFPSLRQLPSLQLFISEALPYLSSLYLLILFFLFIRFAQHYIYSRRLKEVTLSEIQPELRVFVEKAGKAMGIGKEVRIGLSSLVDSPVTLGFLKPVILLPFAMAANLSLQQAEAILLHELSHIKRHDYLLNMGLRFVETFFFFNPFALLLIRNIKKEREHCCDDLVLQYNYDPHAYASALLSLAKNSQGSSFQLALAASGNNDHLLLNRVRRILKQKESSSRPGAAPVILGLLVLVSAFLNLLMPGSSEPVPEKNTFSPSFDPSIQSVTIVQSVVQSFVQSAPSEPASIVFHSNDPIPASQQRIVSGLIASGRGSKNLQATLKDMLKGIKEISVKVDKIEKKRGMSNKEVNEPEEPENEDRFLVAEADADQDRIPGDFAVTFRPDIREYTLGSLAATIPAIPAGSIESLEMDPRLPFVPTSNFTFRHIQDTTQPDGQQLVYLQKMASREIEKAIKNLQVTIQRQILLIQSLASQPLRPDAQTMANIPNMPNMANRQDKLPLVTGAPLQKAQVQIRILEEQLKLQQQYLLKQQELERKLEKTGKRLTIVVI